MICRLRVQTYATVSLADVHMLLSLGLFLWNFYLVPMCYFCVRKTGQSIAFHMSRGQVPHAIGFSEHGPLASGLS